MLCFRRNVPLDGAVITTPFEAKDTISKRYSGSVLAIITISITVIGGSVQRI